MARLDELKLDKAVEALTPAVTQKKDAVLRARALWQLGRLGNLKYVNAAFSDPDPRFRILAMRILSDWHDKSPADYVTEWRDALLKDPSPAVRRRRPCGSGFHPTRAAPWSLRWAACRR